MVPPAFLEIFPFLRVKTSLRGQMVQFVNTEFVWPVRPVGCCVTA